MTDDEQLLRQYTEVRSESAFGDLVSRHIDLVYSVALRVVNGDTHLAQDVTQTVFIDLARKAKALPRRVVLAGWLHRHTCYKAATAVRTEQRRKAREQTAMEIRALDDNAESPWELIAPYLDEALNQLRPSDRDAVVLRFLKRQDLRAVGVALGVSEDSAQKRVSRALEKLRHILGRRGVALSATALASALAGEVVTAAPAGLAVSATAAALTASVGTGTLLTYLELMAATKVKTGIICAIIAAGVATPLVIHQQAQAKLQDQDRALRTKSSRVADLQEENERLSNALTRAGSPPVAPDRQFNEVLRLRGEVGRLQGTVRELKQSGTNSPQSREEVLDSMRQVYLDRVNQLKQLFAAHPDQAVPELQYLADSDWIDIVKQDRSRTDPENRHAMSLARSRGQIIFAMRVLSDALRQYGKNHGGQFPADLSELAPYFTPPLDDSILRGWAILPTGSLPEKLRVDGDWALTQKAPVDAAHDQRVVINMRSTRLGTGTNQWGSVP